MKVDLIGMILNNSRPGVFGGILKTDDGYDLDAVATLDTMMFEHVRVRTGGESTFVAVCKQAMALPQPEANQAELARLADLQAIGHAAKAMPEAIGLDEVDPEDLLEGVCDAEAIAASKTLADALERAGF